MSVVLDRIAQRFSQRLRTHRKMLSSLGIVVTAEEAASVLPLVRESLLACTRCAEPETCECWARDGHPGLPVWCRARETFERLAVETGAPGVTCYDA